VSDAILEITELSKRFAGLMALDSVSLQVGDQEIVGLIGPNGAGKTTCFNCVTGFLPPTSGRVRLRGDDVTDMSPPARAARGMARTFQQVHLFGHLTVEENLLLGRHLHYGASAVESALRLPRARRAESAARSAVRDIAAECGLALVLDARVGDLPYGTQRMVEVARAIATEPAVLLLDEPSAGMDTAESSYFGQLLQRVHAERGLTTLVIEHDVALVTSVCDRIYVLDFGRLIADGTPAQIRRDPLVQAAYLGDDRGLLANA
jgi:branched-chain amino acid transport system ATP-binding protein